MHNIDPNNAVVFTLVGHGKYWVQGVPILLNMPVPKILPSCPVIT